MSRAFRRKSIFLASACAVVASLAVNGTANGQFEPPQDVTQFGPAGAKCKALRDTNFRMTEDAPAQITAARILKGGGAIPDICEVEGYVWRNVRFRIQFPLQDWNGKMVLQGNGGQGGYLPVQNPNSKQPHKFPSPQESHYAVIGHDSGHFSTVADTLWSRDNMDGAIDDGFRAGHVTALIGKAILKSFYGQAPAKSYYEGCSNSGREALMEAEHFPWDFDGIIAGDPSLAVTNLTINFWWDQQIFKDQSRKGLDPAAIETLHKGVLAQCDALDGKTDGIIDDPRKCRIDFKPLLCKGKAEKTCLTQHQIDLAREVYDGPRNPDGSQIVPSSAFPGSEQMWIPFATPNWVADYPADILRNELLDPPEALNWDPDPAKLAEYAKRTGVGEIISGAENPDIRKFTDRGGKLLMYYGWSDGIGGAREAMDYYETAGRVLGSQAADNSLRLYMIPGMNHCGGGEGASVFDWVGTIDSWVTKGEAPKSVSGYHPGPDGDPQWWRAIEPYTSSRAP